MAFLPQRYALAVPPCFVNWYLLRVDLWRCHMKQTRAPLQFVERSVTVKMESGTGGEGKEGQSLAWIAQWQSRCELGVCSAIRGQRILRSTCTECRCELCSCGAAPGPKASVYVTKGNMIHGHRFSQQWAFVRACMCLVCVKTTMKRLSYLECDLPTTDTVVHDLYRKIWGPSRFRG